MIEMKYDNYIVEKICRLNVRYYLIKVHNRYYVIDYSNPRRITNYFLPYSNNKDWVIYDVTKGKDQYIQKSSLSIANFSWYINIVFLLIIIYLAVTPNKFNLHYLTYNPTIKNHWLLFFISVMINAIFIAVLLIKNSQHIKINSEGSYKIKLSKGGSKEFNLFFRSFIVLVLSLAFILWGIFSSSYISLFLFSYCCTYSIWFANFIDFQLIQPRRKYKISKIYFD